MELGEGRCGESSTSQRLSPPPCGMLHQNGRGERRSSQRTLPSPSPPASGGDWSRSPRQCSEDRRALEGSAESQGHEHVPERAVPGLGPRGTSLDPQSRMQPRRPHWDRGLISAIHPSCESQGAVPDLACILPVLTGARGVVSLGAWGTESLPVRGGEFSGLRVSGPVRSPLSSHALYTASEKTGPFQNHLISRPFSFAPRSL